MKTARSTYPGRFLMPEPITDPPWVRAPFSGCGPPPDTGPPKTVILLQQTIVSELLFLKGESK